MKLSLVSKLIKFLLYKIYESNYQLIFFKYLSLVNKKKINSTYENYCKLFPDNLNNEVISYITNNFKNSNIYILSGGFDILIEPIRNFLKIELILSTNTFDFRNKKVINSKDKLDYFLNQIKPLYNSQSFFVLISDNDSDHIISNQVDKVIVKKTSSSQKNILACSDVII
tara:strand:- start:152 stop:661 length:510 start_codon:yes stop_codon:yes gene_type:complete